MSDTPPPPNWSPSGDDRPSDGPLPFGPPPGPPPSGQQPPFGPPAGPPPYGQPPSGPPIGPPSGYGYDQPSPYSGGSSYRGYVRAAPHPKGTTILVTGILSILCCGLLGPVAWVMGSAALQVIDASPGAYTNRSAVVAGRICGIISSVLLLVGIVFYVAA